ncbi:phosphoribosylamine--glycine ligase [Desnuesiella massiliensis]|uniref:phosphoribosylamine--glycine ligase n=1 Tax=Desnuesiella massiliensis TaxID=1650662 RepID=UPI0006E29502|nr:phosphoribosylamine--glycine ligase [Desnuesiella massiliensis]
MKILIIGSGGREHALAWKISQNPSVKKIYCAPGNGGSALEDKCENINILDIDELLAFSKKNQIDLTVVGPEEPLTKGIVDKFKSQGLNIFGPALSGAKLEGSKVYAKDFMKKYGVKTAAYESFKEASSALQYIKNCEYPIVIKADGLAAGKGVVICDNQAMAEETINAFMLEDIFKGSGKDIVIEEFLQGVEASILSITDGETILPFISAKDHKQILDGDKGPNTGGMGVIAPNPYVNEEVMKDFNINVVEPTLRGLKAENMDFKGIIFFGIMITSKGTYLLEYNVRLGDPETQAILSLMKNDLLELIETCLEGNLSSYKLQWKSKSACCVVAASSGYPGIYEKGFPINIEKSLKGKVFIAGAELKNNVLKTTGGRVLSLVSLGDNLEEAKSNAYKELKEVNFENMYYRSDIGVMHS